MKAKLLFSCLVLLFAFSTYARLQLQYGEYYFCNKSTNSVFVAHFLADGKELVGCGILNPYQCASVYDERMFPWTLPQFFQIEYKDSNGVIQTDKLDTGWIKLKKAKEGKVYFVYSPEKKFVLKIYLPTNRDDIGMRLEGKFLPDEDNPNFKSYKEFVRASIDGNTEQVREFLTNGAPYAWPNEPVSGTPLFWSVRWNQKKTFNVLIEHMPKDFYPYEYYWCIQMAAQNGQLEILKKLLQSPLANDVPKLQLQEIFYDTCYHPNTNCIETLKILLDHFKVGIDYKTRDFGHTLLFVAIDSGDVKLIKWLLTQGANPNAKLENGETPLQYARNETIKKLLVDAGAK